MASNYSVAHVIHRAATFVQHNDSNIEKVMTLCSTQCEGFL